MLAHYLNFAILGNLGPLEIILILLAILLLFGAKRIPEIAKGLGKGMKEFKKAVKDVQDDLTDDDDKSKKD